MRYIIAYTNVYIYIEGKWRDEPNVTKMIKCFSIGCLYLLAGYLIIRCLLGLSMAMKLNQDLIGVFVLKQLVVHGNFVVSLHNREQHHNIAVLSRKLPTPYGEM